jgi:UDPglucose--hexose-1-phosphate uridylyltransferase
MDVFTPIPSVLYKKYFDLYGSSPKAATDYFYSISKSSNYIMTDRINKNILWKTNVENIGELDLTINLSKPEKDPKEIALAKLKQSETKYPKCALCKENMGYEGNANQASRANHRIVPITLGDENWYLQYSPYGYFNEHCILLHSEHEPMEVTKRTFERLMSFVQQYPHYKMGSNAGLPIVGGSILTHDHYQGGNYEFPINKCGYRTKISFDGFEDVELVLLTGQCQP